MQCKTEDIIETQDNVSPAGCRRVLAKFPSPSVERGLFILNVPGLKKAEKSVTWWASVSEQPKHIYLSLNSLGISTALAIDSVIRPGLG